MMQRLSLKRKEVKNYLSEKGTLDLEEVVLKFHFEYLMKDNQINLVRVRLNGIDGIKTDNIEYAMKKFKHWNCEWIEIID